MHVSVRLNAAEVDVARRADASPLFVRAESADFWQRWEFTGGPVRVGLYLGRGTGPTRASERERKLDTWPTRCEADQAEVEESLRLAAAILEGQP